MKYKSSVDSGKDADTLTRCPRFSLLIPPLALSDDAADDAEVNPFFLASVFGACTISWHTKGCAYIRLIISLLLLWCVFFVVCCLTFFDSLFIISRRKIMKQLAGTTVFFFNCCKELDSRRKIRKEGYEEQNSR